MRPKPFIKAVGVVATVGAVVLAGMLSSPRRAEAIDDDERGESKIQRGFQIAPVPLNLAGKNRALVGLGSYIMNAASDCAAVLEAGTLTTRGLVALLRTLRDHIAGLDRRIEQLVLAHPDGVLFASLPGASAALVPRLIVAMGTRRERYDSAFEVQCYSGIAPVQESSGKTSWVHFRRTCPTFLRQTFHEFALHSIGQSEWAKAYYQHLREDENKTHQAAVRSLAYKWIRIIFRCWKDNKPYDEEVYLQSLRRRGSLIVGALGYPPVLGGGRSLVSKSFLKIMLDGLTQKTRPYRADAS